MELTPENRLKLITLCKQRVEKDGIADIHALYLDHKHEIGGDGIKLAEAERVGHILVDNDNEYEMRKDERAVYITKNKKYELEESVKNTNDNVRKSNNAIVIASMSTALFALGAFVVSVLSFTNSEKLKPELLELNKTLQKQEQRLQELEPSLKEITASIEKLKIDTPISIRLTK